MISRLFSFSLAMVSALSMGLALPAHAENQAQNRKPAQQDSPEAAKLEKMRVQIVEKLKKIKNETMKVYDKDGKEVSFDDLVSNPSAYKDGVGISFAQHRFTFRGEVISEGAKGLKIFVSHSINDGPADSGQVITLSPEMTKRAIEQRFRDAIESLMITTNASAAKGDAKRGVASTGDCGYMGLLGFVALIFFIGQSNTRAFPLPVNLAISAVAAVGAIYEGSACFGSKGT